MGKVILIKFSKILLREILYSLEFVGTHLLEVTSSPVKIESCFRVYVLWKLGQFKKAFLLVE